MVSWLISNAPLTFEELAFPRSVIKSLKSASISSDPPHLLITGPAGVGKTIAWQLFARQILGVSWKSTTHILQCRDLVRKRGAMAQFEEFLRPGGSKTETLAGMLSLDSFDRSIFTKKEGDIPPAGKENQISNIAPISRLIILEDGVCNACKTNSLKKGLETDWQKREEDFIELCSQIKNIDNSNWDCVVPVSGGKDSYFQVHIIKNIFNTSRNMEKI